MDTDLSGLLPHLHWPSNAWVTQNFLSCAQGDEIDGINMSAHIRRANNLVIFENETVLLISEREAEHILHALRVVPYGRISAGLVNLAMCRWTAASPACPWTRVSLAVGHLPQPPGMTCSLNLAIVGAQLFSGEIEYERQSESCSLNDSDTAAGNSRRRAAVVDVLFGRQNRQLSRQQAAAAAHALVQLRGRQQCWHGSDLQGICMDETRTEPGEV